MTFSCDLPEVVLAPAAHALAVYLEPALEPTHLVEIVLTEITQAAVPRSPEIGG
jgi:hypothetical protein